MEIPQSALMAGAMAILAMAAFFIVSSAPGDYDSMAKCMASKGVKMYGAVWCSHCNEEKKMFGTSWKYMNYVECSVDGGREEAQICKDAGITAYPTWEFADGTKLAQVFTLGELSEKTGCPLK